VGAGAFLAGPGDSATLDGRRWATRQPGNFSLARNIHTVFLVRFGWIWLAGAKKVVLPGFTWFYLVLPGASKPETKAKS
jgi:hypothetical protein